MPATAAPPIAGVRKDVLTAFAAREAARYAKGRPKSAGGGGKGAAPGYPACRCTGWPIGRCRICP